MDFTETDLRNIVREEIKKQCIFVKPSDAEDLEPMTYDYLINRNKGLPVVVDKKKKYRKGRTIPLWTTTPCLSQ